MEMPRNRFKARLAAGELQLGLWSTIPEATAVEALAGAGFDWMVLDTEHTAVEVAAVLPLLQAMACSSTAPVVRPSLNDTALIKRHLDQGAQTLLVPYVESRAEAEAAAAAVRYPPRGVRGVAGTMRAAGYGRIAGYHAQADAEVCLLLQVETARAVSLLDEIATTEGVDGIFIGPADLAASMGHLGQAGHPEVRAAVLDTIARLARLGVPAGILTQDADFARQTIDAGARFVALAVDMSLLVRAADALVAGFRT